MSIADFINNLPDPGGDIPPEVEAKFVELSKALRICDDEEEVRQLLLLNGKQEMPEPLKNHRGASFAFLRAHNWPSMIVAIRPLKETPVCLFALALPPEMEDEAGAFFLALLKAIQSALGVEKIQSRRCSSPANN